jgi:predicted metal-dependent phosphoesterase TrpH
MVQTRNNRVPCGSAGHKLKFMAGTLKLYFTLLPAFVLALAALNGRSEGPEQTPSSRSAKEVVLRGAVTGSQNNTYIEAPFEVPAGTQRVTLTFSYTGKEQRTTLDIGLLDPKGLRCWIGGNKSTFTVSATDATPSCLAGPVAPGTWRLLIGVPNIRPNVTAAYTANVFFTDSGLVRDQPLVLRGSLRSGPAWFRGDLHMHTAHSDGSCNSVRGVKVPCPVFVIAEAATRRGLDFIAVTDHNTTSQNDAMRELQPYFDSLLMIPGREMTTFHGHANLFGTVAPLDFRVGSRDVPDINTLFRRANQIGGLVSINHPNAPTGEACMGCGWNPTPEADLNLVQAVEAVNSGAEDGPFAGLSFWEKQLNRGFRLTGIGGSDNHTAQRPLDEVGSIGSPTTVVYATELSTPAILEAIRAGHVFVDLTASKDRLLELHAQRGDATASMGDTLAASVGSEVEFSVHVAGVDGAKLVFLEDGQPMAEPSTEAAIQGRDQTILTRWKSDGRQHWFRADVHGPDGKLWLMGNPIYMNWSTSGRKEVTR